MRTVRTYLPWILALWIAFVFIQSLFFKFADAPETVHIFTTIGTWLGMEWFANYGGYIVGTVELIASILLFIPPTQVIGAALAIGVMTGAIFFHLVSPLGVVVVNEAMGVESDGGTLFIMACSVWIAGWIILFLRWDKVVRLLPFLPGGRSQTA